LSNRKQRILINNSNSQWRDIKAGVPHGSILGPLLFIFFINDIVTDVQSTIKLFADDTSLYLIVDDPNETADSLNNDVTKIHDWATKWLVTFKAQKMETMTISRKIDKPDHPPLYRDSVDISTVSEHKHLGLVISENGSWEKHTDMITAYKRINILRKFKFILDRKTLEKIYLHLSDPY
jgi:hypothetical protein